MISNNDTICAIATAPGGAIGVIRVSGAKALLFTQQIFQSSTGKNLSEAQPQSLLYGNIIDENREPVDEVLVSLFRHPHSYSGEDSTEISCHGSSYILRRVMELLIAQGCRQALPGEFTQRAFLNGKMDLSQAEAVADLVSASNRATHKMALSQLRGNFSHELSSLREQLLKLTSLLELELDFSEEDVNFADRNQLLDIAHLIEQRIKSLTNSFTTGNAIKNGVPVAIIGKTNVGKSTLLNKLVHEEKAIVSDIHGTTRDIIEDVTEIHGITFRFIDTAGIRTTSDEIEKLGIERTFKKLHEASIVIWMVDSQPSADEINNILDLCQDKSLILTINKCDQEDVDIDNSLINNTKSQILHISAKFGTHIEDLEQALYQSANIPEITENNVIVTNLRHYEALIRSEASINRVIEGLNNDLSGDLLSEDLRDCIHSLAEIVGGEVTSNEILGNIFSHFCIGK